MVIEPIAAIFVGNSSQKALFGGDRLIESLFFFWPCDGKNRGGLPENRH